MYWYSWLRVSGTFNDNGATFAFFGHKGRPIGKAGSRGRHLTQNSDQRWNSWKWWRYQMSTCATSSIPSPKLPFDHVVEFITWHMSTSAWRNVTWNKRKSCVESRSLTKSTMYQSMLPLFRLLLLHLGRCTCTGSDNVTFPMVSLLLLNENGL